MSGHVVVRFVFRPGTGHICVFQCRLGPREGAGCESPVMRSHVLGLSLLLGITLAAAKDVGLFLEEIVRLEIFLVLGEMGQQTV